MQTLHIIPIAQKKPDLSGFKWDFWKYHFSLTFMTNYHFLDFENNLWAKVYKYNILLK